MLHNSFDNKSQIIISDVRNYLLESGLQHAANAYDKAISEVINFEINGTYSNYFSKKVNRYLCEALIGANSESKVNDKHVAILRSLIESYRNIYGLSTDDFEYFIIDHE